MFTCNIIRPSSYNGNADEEDVKPCHSPTHPSPHTESEYGVIIGGEGEGVQDTENEKTATNA